MSSTRRNFMVAGACLVLAAPAAAQTPKKCPIESVKVGNTCIDLYEASVWQVPITETSVIKKIQKGKITLTELTDVGAVQLGCTFAPWNVTNYPANFPDDGNWTPVFGSDPPSAGVYAVSVPGVLPSTCITQFQAAQACAHSGKRLITNDEWQRAAAGTPDPGNVDDGNTTCVTNSANPDNTGDRANCKSSWGTFDQVGNVYEWVSDWSDRATGACTNWNASAGISDGDFSCFGGDASFASAKLPGAPVRGGFWFDGTTAGVFTVAALNNPAMASDGIGFRCAR